MCYCGDQQDPPADPWLSPHSCGSVCQKQLKPSCGHTCLLLCHPGNTHRHTHTHTDRHRDTHTHTHTDTHTQIHTDTHTDRHTETHTHIQTHTHTHTHTLKYKMMDRKFFIINRIKFLTFYYDEQLCFWVLIIMKVYSVSLSSSRDQSYNTIRCCHDDVLQGRVLRVQRWCLCPACVATLSPSPVAVATR